MTEWNEYEKKDGQLDRVNIMQPARGLWAQQAPAAGEEESATLATRFHPPEGFERQQAEEGSFAEYLREYPVREMDSPVLLYDGREKGNQEAHAAVLALPLEGEDLQQCADSVMRIYAEYFFSQDSTRRYNFILPMVSLQNM